MISRVAAAFSSIVFIVSLCHAVPVPDLEYGTVPQRDFRASEDQCHLQYYNICSGWIQHWVGYCFWMFDEVPLPPMYGTCFDLEDCPGNCRHLEDVWWACQCLHYWGWADIEVYCADEDCCPVGSPIAGIYDYFPHIPPWQHFNFGGLPLCPCDETGDGKFVIMITHYIEGPWGIAFKPYSDLNSYNIAAGCESEWRCEGHSYVYRNAVDYCDVYAAPAALWRPGLDYGCTTYPTFPPGCNSYWNTGYSCEWLIDCYISCLGPTATEKESWSEIKALYR